MFLCEVCLKIRKVFAIPFSLGKCENCGEVKVCADIHHSKLPIIEPKEDYTLGE